MSGEQELVGLESKPLISDIINTTIQSMKLYYWKPTNDDRKIRTHGHVAIELFYYPASSKKPISVDDCKKDLDMIKGQELTADYVSFMPYNYMKACTSKVFNKNVKYKINDTIVKDEEDMGRKCDEVKAFEFIDTERNIEKEEFKMGNILREHANYIKSFSSGIKDFEKEYFLQLPNINSVRLYYWEETFYPPNYKKEEKRNAKIYGHVAIEVIKFKHETEGGKLVDKVISTYISAMPSEGNRYKTYYNLDNTYSQDKLAMKNTIIYADGNSPEERPHTNSVVLYGLDVDKIIKCFEQIEKKPQPFSLYYFNNPYSCYLTFCSFVRDIFSQSQGPDEEGTAQYYYNTSNCASLAFTLLVKGGLKQHLYIPAFHTRILIVSTILLSSFLGFKIYFKDNFDSDSDNLLLFGMGGYLLFIFFSYLILQCVIQTYQGYGHVKTPAGLYKLVSENKKGELDFVRQLFNCNVMIATFYYLSLISSGLYIIFSFFNYSEIKPALLISSATFFSITALFQVSITCTNLCLKKAELDYSNRYKFFKLSSDGLEEKDIEMNNTRGIS